MKGIDENAKTILKKVENYSCLTIAQSTILWMEQRSF